MYQEITVEGKYYPTYKTKGGKEHRAQYALPFIGIKRGRMISIMGVDKRGNLNYQKEVYAYTEHMYWTASNGEVHNGDVWLKERRELLKKGYG